jgi:hypothetical protein
MDPDQLAALADMNQFAIDHREQPISGIFRGADLVMGVVRDPGSPGGIDIVPLKGKAALRKEGEERRAYAERHGKYPLTKLKLKLTAIHCRSRKEALEFAVSFGDGEKPSW